MPDKKIAIHQPNFFPWLGFFNKIHKADHFVYLDHVENNPRTAIYTKRVKLLVNKQEHWLTYNLKSGSGKVFFRIDEMQIDAPERQRDKHLKTIELSYKKAPYFNEIFPTVVAFYDHKSEFIAERNISFIDEICEKLKISTKRTRSRDLNVNTSSNQLLIDIVKCVEGSVYIPGGGATGYQEDELFERNDIKIEYQNFNHPQYTQFNSNSFLPGLSVIDLLMNKGFKDSENLIKNA